VSFCNKINAGHPLVDVAPAAKTDWEISARPKKDFPGGSPACGVRDGFYVRAASAAKIRQRVTMPENISGTTKKYLQLRKVTMTKQAAKPQVTIGIAANCSLGRPPSCHAKIAANSRKTVTKNPKPT
jgi:hypothetical protein